MEKRFLVKWEIDEFAETPLEALKKAILALPHQGNEETLATVFTVSEIDINTNEVKTTVNLDVLDFNPFLRPTKLEQLADLFKQVRHELPIDLTERNEEFELDNGCIAKQLLEDVCTYEIDRDGDEIEADYENLTDSDLDEIIRIVENVVIENQKTFNKTL